jgi:hypothetical protein
MTAVTFVVPCTSCHSEIWTIASGEVHVFAQKNGAESFTFQVDYYFAHFG